jgi:hypothetical protein
VAVATIHSKLIDVKRVIKGDRLRGLVANASIFRGKVVSHSGDNAGGNDSDANQDFDWQPVAKTWENVGHGGVRGSFTKGGFDVVLS